jgi:hypothetical protein
VGVGERTSMTGLCHSQKWENEHGLYKKPTSALGTTDSNNLASLKACGYADLFLTFSTKNSRRLLHIFNSTIIDKPVQVKNIHRVFINPSDLNLIKGRNPLTVVCSGSHTPDCVVRETRRWERLATSRSSIKILWKLVQMATWLRFVFFGTNSLGLWVRFGNKRFPRGPSWISNCRQTCMFFVNSNSKKCSFELVSYPTMPCRLHFSAYEAPPKKKFCF